MAPSSYITMSTSTDNRLVNNNPSETSPQVQLHPNVLVNLNDHATRNVIRRQGPVLGALLGRNEGTSVSVETSFECGSQILIAGPDQSMLITNQWMDAMIGVCKSPPTLIPI